MPWSLVLSTAAGALAGAGAVLLANKKKQNSSSSSNDGDGGDVIVETGTPHPEWQPGDLQPHPYLSFDDDGGGGGGGGGGAADDNKSKGDKKDSADEKEKEKKEKEKEKARIRAALLAAPRHTIDPAVTPGSVLYPLTISAVVPRPIALVSTLSPPVDDDDDDEEQEEDGENSGNGKKHVKQKKKKRRLGNLSPFSYFGLVAHDPPHVAIGTCATSGKPDRAKDTQHNVLSTKEFVVNVMSEWYVEAANHTCGHYDRGVDEMALSGLTPQSSVKVAPPRVAEAAVQLECRLVASYPVQRRNSNNGDAAAETTTTTTTILIGEVLAMHVLDAVSSPTADGKSLVVNPRKLKPVCRLGGDTYGTLGRLFDLPRPGKEWQERREATRAASENR